MEARMNTLRVCFVFIFLASSLSLIAQDHAPTQPQCVADERLWTSELSEYFDAETAHTKVGLPNNTDMNHLGIPAILRHEQEMMQCAVVDPTNAEKYNEVFSSLDGIRLARYAAFVLRHHLETQLLTEDGKGLR
jgi:hypothetical protein